MRPNLVSYPPRFWILCEPLKPDLMFVSFPPFKVLVSRSSASSGQEIHLRDHGSQVCRGCDSEPGGDVAGVHDSSAHDLFSLHGLWPHQQCGKLGQETRTQWVAESNTSWVKHFMKNSIMYDMCTHVVLCCFLQFFLQRLGRFLWDRGRRCTQDG